ncbi:hypothetical protein TR13x_08085 [Caloranaerobacter sp. TR13]|uniref:hypothetical protein n=1 Tax=Caloranaerobacter sp. TR13 TaxID=1302151 RepID=UPI0006D484EA|nr:hypothetical protein [Caloranaerobacter sp. TR13]KPU26856.1 hypothetical protein TR13x_08085 [Caloranaerobacter sp. TR13]
MKIAVVIPTYWGELNGDEEVIFDHPTPLYTEGTLGRLLKNLATFEEMKDIPVYIIGISNKEELRDSVEKYLEKYLEPYKEKLNIELYSNSFLMECISKLGDKKSLSYLFDFKGYSQVRNFSLLPVIMNDIDVAIFLDDDEIIEDRDYFTKAVEYINKDTKYGKVYGKAGYYINGDTYILSTEKIPVWNYGGWNKVKYMNEAFERLIEANERLLPTALALGGNMVLSKEIMREICYDVHVHRGEDMDYLFNAKMFNYTILFDNELKITHLPPQSGSLEWKRARADFYRFKYIRRKLKALKEHTDLQQISIETLMPYPGVFMQDDFEVRAKDYTILLGMHYLSKGDIENYKNTMENIKVIYSSDNEGFDPILEYKQQRQDWKTLISILCK